MRNAFLLGGFLFSMGVNTAAHAQLDVTYLHESVLDKVNHTPNLPGGGFAEPQSKQRYLQEKLSVKKTFGNGQSLAVGFSQYNIASLRDEIAVNQLDLNWTKSIFFNKGHELFFSFGAAHSFSSSFEKNSFTITDAGIITSASIESPKDSTLSIATGFKRPLFKRSAISTVFELGFQATQFSRLQGAGVSNSGCAFAFLSANAGGQLSQTEPCGQVNTYQQTYPNDELLFERLGVAPSRDIPYNGWYIGNTVEVSRHLSAGTMVRASYGFKFFSRNGIDTDFDERIHEPTVFTHDFLLGMQKRVAKHWIFSLQARYQIAPFIGNIPFLYTRYTSSRYQRSAPSFAFSVGYTI